MSAQVAQPTLADRLMAAMRAPAQSRAARYMARVDNHLPTLADDAARVAFLNGQLSDWQTRYSAWAWRIDNGTADSADLTQTAFDYIETITALGGRVGEFERKREVA